MRCQFLNSLQCTVMPSRTRSDDIVKHTLEKRKAQVILIVIDSCSSLIVQPQCSGSS